MRITILNGDQDQKTTGFTKKIDNLVEELKVNNKVAKFDLYKMDLNYCIGCWNCWWKTPGECVFQDDGEKIFRSVINSDLVIFASPLVAGFTTALLKKITDRLIVLVHPYIIIKNREYHHLKRYKTYPEMGVIYQREKTTDCDDIKIIKEMYDRLSINIHSGVKFFSSIENIKISEVIDEVSNI